MKKTILLIVLIAAMCSCESVFKAAYTKNAYVLDYSEYTNKGFFLTESNSVNFDYKSLGSVSSLIYSGYEILNNKVNSQKMVYTVDNVQNPKKIRYGKYINATSKDALDELCEKAMEIGANGIINIKVNYIPAEYDYKTGVRISEDGMFVTGMAIRK